MATHLAYSYAPYAYAGHYGYYGLGHHYGYYGRKKREATAEADADASPEADPWLLYGAYGPDLHMEDTTATATTTPPTPTLEAAVTISVVSSPVPLAGREERRCEQKIKIDSLEPCFNFSFRVHPKSLSKH